MKRLQNHLIGIDQGSRVLFSDFEHDGEMWTGTGPRQHRQRVEFSHAYRAVPVVHVTMSMFDMDQKTNQRADISAEYVDEEGFEIVFRTWGDTRVARVRADWMAIGEVRHEDEWDLY
jgi:hypothetical protein